MANLFKLLFGKGFEEKINNELDKMLAESDAYTKEMISDIAEHYLQMARFITPDKAN